MNMNKLLNQVFDKDKIINTIDDFEKELSNGPEHRIPEHREHRM